MIAWIQNIPLILKATTVIPSAIFVTYSLVNLAKKRYVSDWACYKLSYFPCYWKKWINKILLHWDIGEKAAKSKLKNFIKTKLHNYGSGRDRPDIEFTSKLSPHLHFGEISPKRIFLEVMKYPLYLFLYIQPFSLIFLEL